MSELVTVGEIQDRIFKIRGQPVMLDRDLATLYGMRTIALRQQVRRNMDHFPDLKVMIAIMRAFVKLRHAALRDRDVTRRVEKLEDKVDMHETDIRLLVQDVQNLKKRPRPSGPINPSIL